MKLTTLLIIVLTFGFATAGRMPLLQEVAPAGSLFKPAIMDRNPPVLFSNDPPHDAHGGKGNFMGDEVLNSDGSGKRAREKDIRIVIRPAGGKAEPMKNLKRNLIEHSHHQQLTHDNPLLEQSQPRHVALNPPDRLLERFQPQNRQPEHSHPDHPPPENSQLRESQSQRVGLNQHHGLPEHPQPENQHPEPPQLEQPHAQDQHIGLNMNIPGRRLPEQPQSRLRKFRWNTWDPVTRYFRKSHAANDNWWLHNICHALDRYRCEAVSAIKIRHEGGPVAKFAVKPRPRGSKWMTVNRFGYVDLKEPGFFDVPGKYLKWRDSFRVRPVEQDSEGPPA